MALFALLTKSKKQTPTEGLNEVGQLVGWPVCNRAELFPAFYLKLTLLPGELYAVQSRSDQCWPEEN